MAIRYAEDKPKSCEYCYFWNEKKKECRKIWPSVMEITLVGM